MCRKYWRVARQCIIIAFAEVEKLQRGDRAFKDRTRRPMRGVYAPRRLAERNGCGFATGAGQAGRARHLAENERDGRSPHGGRGRRSQVREDGARDVSRCRAVEGASASALEGTGEPENEGDEAWLCRRRQTLGVALKRAWGELGCRVRAVRGGC
jgi:hypothetical protein